MMLNSEILFQELHQKYADMVHQVSLGFLNGDTNLAKDLCQEVFINTWASLDKFKGESSHKTWIYRITVNTCLKHIREHKKNSNVTLEKRHTNISNERDDQHDPKFSSLYRAVGKLEELDRLIIMMVLDELEYDEIAKIIGISEGTLRVKIHRIKKKLKAILNNG